MDYIIPVLIGAVVLYGVIKKVNVFESFRNGAKEGLMTLYAIAPVMIGLLLAVGMVRASGALDFLTEKLRPLFEKLGYPTELVPMALLRPVSGSGATALLTDIYERFGADSFLAKCASVLAGSTETTFYAVTMYYGAVNIKNIRHTLFAALAADVTAMVMCVVTVSLLMS
ncbi:MAG: spore maturation protein [Ruminococcus sp.]|nr:spore maturation protein [Ruminococcus sp.]